MYVTNDSPGWWFECASLSKGNMQILQRGGSTIKIVPKTATLRCEEAQEQLVPGRKVSDKVGQWQVC